MNRIILLKSNLVVLLALCLSTSASSEDFAPEIPRVWVDREMESLELPLAEPEYSPRAVSASHYYQIPVLPIYKSYPVYHPDGEPEGYLDKLRRLEPEVLWDGHGNRPELTTREDWIRAGELVFDAPILIGGGQIAASGRGGFAFRDPEWHELTGTPVTEDGIVPFYRYVIREKGNVAAGALSCAMCHTRVMDNGMVLKGAQGNFPFSRAMADDYRTGKSEGALGFNRKLEKRLYFVPWLNPNPLDPLEHLNADQLAEPHSRIPAGVMARHRTRPGQPVQVPDLIGVKERRYLDRTGLQQHRGIVDLMRYAALNQGMDDLSHFGDFLPVGVFTGGAMPSPGRSPLRYSDEQLYALALYVYSLEPPENPNPYNEPARTGERIFNERGCVACHAPPLYTNNALTPADGFDIPEEHRQLYRIHPASVGTDPGLTMTTRRGTGYYKVPSLKGLWYRGPFEHNGSVASLEDWFDPDRLEEDYVPTGWVGPPGTETRAVKGHRFGLNLTDGERNALIAFLKTL